MEVKRMGAILKIIGKGAIGGGAVYGFEKLFG
ncbi:leaderless bacteriocin [Staphylococcus hyicus]|nr:leaderless bacteriocin [Staphylococcus hyicus]